MAAGGGWEGGMSSDPVLQCSCSGPVPVNALLVGILAWDSGEILYFVFCIIGACSTIMDMYTEKCGCVFDRPVRWCWFISCAGDVWCEYEMECISLDIYCILHI